MSPSATSILSASTLKVRKGPFALGSWDPARLSAVYAGVLRTRCDICLVMRDDLEITVLLPEASLPELPPPRKVEGRWALLTLDTIMEWDVIGVLAEVTRVLAGAGIPVGAFAAFSRDHLLVQAEYLEPALAKLAAVCKTVKWAD
ncbi:MAG: hypothetical protein ACI9EF_000677 [Pseudohongiellaceae bacterium]